MVMRAGFRRREPTRYQATQPLTGKDRPCPRPRAGVGVRALRGKRSPHRYSPVSTCLPASAWLGRFQAATVRTRVPVCSTMRLGEGTASSMARKNASASVSTPGFQRHLREFAGRPGGFPSPPHPNGRASRARRGRRRHWFARMIRLAKRRRDRARNSDRRCSVVGLENSVLSSTRQAFWLSVAWHWLERGQRPSEPAVRRVVQPTRVRVQAGLRRQSSTAQIVATAPAMR